MHILALRPEISSPFPFSPEADTTSEGGKRQGNNLAAPSQQPGYILIQQSQHTQDGETFRLFLLSQIPIRTPLRPVPHSSSLLNI